jgi:hypothetical protein
VNKAATRTLGFEVFSAWVDMIEAMLGGLVPGISQFARVLTHFSMLDGDDE